MPRTELTKELCRTLPNPEQGQVLHFDTAPDVVAGFALRLTPGARSFVLNYIIEGKQRRITIGSFPALSLGLARKKALQMKGAIYSGTDPLADKKRARAQAKQKREATERTLGALLLAYCDHLDAAGKESAHEVRGMIQNHVENAHPKLWSLTLESVEPEHGVEILRTLVEAGKKRSAGKVRSFLRAAFALAIRSRLDASASGAMAKLGVRTNPMADLPTITGGAGGTRERALSVEELRAYWRRIESTPDPDGALLRFHLLTGGQRVKQLSRATVADIDDDTDTLTLRDPKGRRSEPRVHVVPLIPAARDALDALRKDAAGPYLFTVTKGKKAVDYFAVDNRLRRVVSAMLEAEEAAEPFTLGDLRRSVETRLQALGVTEEVRAHLQSHGLAGVQNRHYAKHRFDVEKRAALEALHRLATGTDAKVTPIKRKKAASK